MGKLECSILLLQHLMPQVISVVLMGCIANTFGQHCRGGMVLLVMTPFSLTQTQISMVCKGLRYIAHVLLFFAFWHHGKHYPCALIHWFSFVGLELDQDTGLWIVEPSFDDSSSPFLVIVYIDSIYRAVHLLAAHQDA